MSNIADTNQALRASLVNKVIVNCGTVNVREEPNPDAKVIKTLWCGERILAESMPIGDYYKVRIQAKEYGYIHKDYVG